MIVTLTVMICLAIDSQSRVKREIFITPEQIARAKSILDTHRYQVYPGTLATIRIRADDADNALNYLAHHFGKGYARVTLHDKSAEVLLSLPIPANIINGYINLQATLIENGRFPEFRSVSIGSLPVPDRFANRLIEKLLAWLQTASPDAHTGLDAFRKLQFSRHEAVVSYFWKGWEIDKVSYSPVSLPFLDQLALEKLSHYHHFLNEQNREHASATIPLSEILTQIMQETVRHSVQKDALEEFRAAILITAFHVVQIPLRLVIPEAANWPDPVKINVTLDGRNDLAMHFMASAAITAYSDTVLSNAIGLYKELEDSRSGSGFSFNDLIADRSGTRFAEKAMANQDSARRMRNIILAGIRDTDLIPQWTDLPEHLSENAFKAHFGDTSSPRYQKMMDKIERRVASLKWQRY
ncbi:hypothetical protein [Nitrosomonas sp.]|uniref:hypothetical protein n=1 Tax=Nitrosomonas sp. TaxID=42353 RepID=UPI0025D142D1|nr:hypothetical protein [Nitrosomonas sp.]